MQLDVASNGYKPMNKVVLITGASSGIGKALAIHAAKNDFSLGIMARSSEMLEASATICKSFGVDVCSVQGDVSINDDCKRFVATCVDRFGRIDILINNAGISMRGIFAHTETSVLAKLMDTNFWGTVYCTKHALPYLLRTNGSVVGISSIAGFKGLPARTGYSASKFAMQGFLEGLRCENIKNGLHVLIVCPGYTESNIRKTALNSEGNPQNETPLDETKLMSAEAVAEATWKAIKHKKLYLILTLQGKLAILINKFFPKLADLLTYNTIKKEPNSPFK